jgi:hypothetical protein
MDNLQVLDEYFDKFSKNINKWIPEGITAVDLPLLQKFDLLHFHNRTVNDPALTRYFHVVESSEKITLINDQFIVWIVPEKEKQTSVTYTLIALNQDHPHLELAFLNKGVFNSSRLVLRILEKFLLEIQENEELIEKFKKVS